VNLSAKERKFFAQLVDVNKPVDSEGAAGVRKSPSDLDVSLVPDCDAMSCGGCKGFGDFQLSAGKGLNRGVIPANVSPGCQLFPVTVIARVNGPLPPNVAS
jgi:hypothetical protein